MPVSNRNAVVISGTLIALGFVALIVAFRAPPEKHEIAVALAHYGCWSLGIGFFIVFAFWLVRRLTERMTAGAGESQWELDPLYSQSPSFASLLFPGRRFELG